MVSGGAVLTIGLLTLLAGLSASGCAGSDPDFCELANRFESSDLGRGSGDLEQRFTDALDDLDDLIEVAPDDIVGDLVTVRDRIEAFVRGTGPLDARFEVASRRVSEYLSDECGIEGSSDEGDQR